MNLSWPRLSQFILPALVAVGVYGGCSPGQPPLLMIQLCLPEPSDLTELVRELQTQSADAGLDFIDQSQNVSSALSRLRKDVPEIPTNSRLVEIVARRPDGHGFSGGNFGLPTNQVVLGFSSGKDVGESERLASAITAALQRKWIVHVLPKDTGALPLKDCPAWDSDM